MRLKVIFPLELSITNNSRKKAFNTVELSARIALLLKYS